MRSIEPHEQFDRALLHGRAGAAREVQDLVEVALEVRDSFSTWGLSERTRRLIHERALALADRRRTRLWRRVAKARRTRAIVGGAAAVTAATAIALGLVRARGHRQRALAA